MAWRYPTKENPSINTFTNVTGIHLMHIDDSVKFRTPPLSVTSPAVVPFTHKLDLVDKSSGAMGSEIKYDFLWGVSDYSVLCNVDWYFEPPSWMARIFSPVSFTFEVYVTHNQQPSTSSSVPGFIVDVDKVLTSAEVVANSILSPQGTTWVKAIANVVGFMRPKTGAKIVLTMTFEWYYKQGSSSTISIGSNATVSSNAAQLAITPAAMQFFCGPVDLLDAAVASSDCLDLDSSDSDESGSPD